LFGLCHQLKRFLNQLLNDRFLGFRFNDPLMAAFPKSHSFLGKGRSVLVELEMTRHGLEDCRLLVYAAKEAPAIC
jgi:hypothetical protein